MTQLLDALPPASVLDSFPPDERAAPRAWLERLAAHAADNQRKMAAQLKGKSP